MRFNKDLMKTISIIILLITLIVLSIMMFLPGYNQKIYEQGLIDGQISVARTQTETGNILIIQNETLQSYPITQICGGTLQ